MQNAVIAAVYEANERIRSLTLSAAEAINIYMFIGGVTVSRLRIPWKRQKAQEQIFALRCKGKRLERK